MQTGSLSGDMLLLSNCCEDKSLPDPPDDRQVRPIEEELAEGCRRRSYAAYQRLFEIHGARMKSLAYHMLGNTADAEDAVQEAFIKIFRAADRFKGDSAFLTWVFRIVVNACHDQMRRRRRRSVELQESEATDLLAALPQPTRSDHPLRVSLEKSLKKLDQRSRTVFLLYEVEGLKHREIAEVLRIPEGTSKNILFNARKELQELLSESGSLARPSHEN